MNKVYKLGSSNDPVIRDLEHQVCLYAGSYRGAWGGYLQADPDEFVRLYHEAIEKLYTLGWDGELDFECLLPRESMPRAYLERHPEILDWKW
ncbi:MAG: hypothetical protein JXA33_12775 [Anaerolineae bacterium]|nr:hypothetical protein [Anaerolineae bacterium]